MKKLFIYMLLTVGLLSPTLALGTQTIYATTQEELKKGACLGDVDCEAETADSTKNNVDEIINTIINVFSWVVGLLAVIMVIFGGFKYVTAAGDTEKTKTAKNTILYALVGIVIVALSQTIVKYVLNLVVT